MLIGGLWVNASDKSIINIFYFLKNKGGKFLWDGIQEPEIV